MNDVANPYGEDAAAAAAKLVLAFETQLAKTHLTPVERRDAEKTYNKYESIAQLPGTAAGAAKWDWASYFKTLGKEHPGEVNVSWPPALEGAVEAVGPTVYWPSIHTHAYFALDFDAFITVVS